MTQPFSTFLAFLLLTLVTVSTSCAPTPTATPTPAPALTPVASPAPSAVPAPASPATTVPTVPTSLQWFGQATFLLTTSTGTRILLDPTNAASGYALQPMQGIDVVTVSHEHPDHNNVAIAQGNPTVIRGLKDNDWVKISQVVKDVKISSVATYHDSKQGAERGKNTVFVFEVDGLRIAHLGDLGHQLDQEQLGAIGPVDLAMAPVGGGYTLDAANATQMLGQLKPRITIPMHFRTPKVSAQSPLMPVDSFLEGKTVEKITKNRAEISKANLPATGTVYLLGYEP